MLCSALINQSEATWNTLINAYSLGGSIGEESITDFLVLDLMRASQLGGFNVRSFKKHEEAVNGADWELWFTGASNLWIGLRIQSKKITVSSLLYAHLHPTAKSGEPTQLRKLVTHANAVSAVPMYALYSAWQPNAVAPAWKCKSFGQTDELWGISLASASAVASIAPANSLVAIAPHMFPIHCLVCCHGYSDADLPTRTAAFLSSHVAIEAPLLEEPPPYLTRLLDTSTRVATENKPELPAGLGYVVVVREQEAG